MNKSQIAEMKATIKNEYEIKINKLREEMEDALSSLSRVEKTLVEEISPENFNVKAIKFSRGAPIGSTPIKRKRLESHTETVEERIANALQKMNGEFTRSELFEKTNNDGSGKEMKMGSFGPKFANLVKEGEIIVLKESKGNQGGIYVRAKQPQVQSETPPDMR